VRDKILMILERYPSSVWGLFLRLRNDTAPDSLLGQIKAECQALRRQHVVRYHGKDHHGKMKMCLTPIGLAQVRGKTNQPEV